MTKSDISVIGAGLMGAGIAQTFAAAGHHVMIFEPLEEVRASTIHRIEQGLETIGGNPEMARLVIVTGDLEQAVAGTSFVTEAGPEKLEVKQEIFRRMVEAAPRHAILSSNSSVIPIGNIAKGLPTQDRMVGAHWWNPATLIPLVEVIQGASTSPETVETTMELLRSIGKFPAHVKKDVPGFIGNRLQHALWREAIAMVADGICDPKTLDDCVKNSFGLRLAVLGPLENVDLVGVDLTIDIHHTILPNLNRDSEPHPLLRQMAAERRLGFKTGHGFYEWTEEEMEAARSQLASHLVAAVRKPDQAAAP